MFFCKECKRNPRTLRSYAKERKNVAFFWKERMPNPDYYSLLSGSHLINALVPHLHALLTLELKLMYQAITKIDQ